MKATIKVNKSLLFKRAWYMVNQKGYSLSFALKMVWADFKETVRKAAIELLNKDYAFSPVVGFNPSPEKMQSYYDSNCYKGD